MLAMFATVSFTRAIISKVGGDEDVVEGVVGIGPEIIGAVVAGVVGIGKGAVDAAAGAAVAAGLALGAAAAVAVVTGVAWPRSVPTIGRIFFFMVSTVSLSPISTCKSAASFRRSPFSVGRPPRGPNIVRTASSLPSLSASAFASLLFSCKTAAFNEAPLAFLAASIPSTSGSSRKAEVPAGCATN